MYAQEIGALDEDVRNCIQVRFDNNVKEIFMQQKKILGVLEKTESENINLSKALLDLIEKDHINPSEKNKECFNKKDCLYISTHYLAEKFYKYYDKKLSSNYIAKYFKDRFISKIDKDKSTKKHENRRYLALEKDRLKEDSEDQTIDIENLF